MQSRENLQNSNTKIKNDKLALSTESLYKVNFI